MYSVLSVSTVVRSYGGALKAPAALLRLRVYQACVALGAGAAPPAPLLRLLAAELAGSADPSGANVATGTVGLHFQKKNTVKNNSFQNSVRKKQKQKDRRHDF